MHQPGQKLDMPWHTSCSGSSINGASEGVKELPEAVRRRLWRPPAPEPLPCRECARAEPHCAAVLVPGRLLCCRLLVVRVLCSPWLSICWSWDLCCCRLVLLRGLP